MKKILALIVLTVVPVFAELQSYMPGGVTYAVNYLGKENGNLKFKIYGSQFINCDRENMTNDPEVGFPVSNHTGIKYNYAYDVNAWQYKRSSSENWNTVGISGYQYDMDYAYPESNLNQLLTNGDVVNIRFRVQKSKASCANEKQQYQNHEYWVHNRTVIPDYAIGGDIETSYEYIYFVYDGDLYSAPTFTLENVTSNYYGEEDKYRLKAYLWLKCEGMTAEQLNEIDADHLQVQFDLVSSNAPVVAPALSFGVMGTWENVVDGNNTYSRCLVTKEISDIDLNRNYYYNYSVIAVYSSAEWGNVQSNQEFVSLGIVKRQFEQYWIRWSVTEEGTVNCVLITSVHTLGGWIGVVTSNENTQWSSSTGESQAGGKFVFNPYRSEDARNVPRNINVTAEVMDNEGNFVRSVYTTVIMPPLGDQSDNDREDQKVEDLPEDEDEQKPNDQFTSQDSLEQTNEILNDMLNEFKNGRDEALSFFRDFAEFSKVTDTSTNYTSSKTPSSPNGAAIEGELGGEGGDVFGDGVGYGETLGDGFGGGLGGNLEDLKSITDHDMTLTFDLTGLGRMLGNSVDTSNWSVTVHLLPDTSTDFGQGVQRITKQYIRPLILYFLYIMLGIACVKDVSQFFGNG